MNNNVINVHLSVCDRKHFFHSLIFKANSALSGLRKLIDSVHSLYLID